MKADRNKISSNLFMRLVAVVLSLILVIGTVTTSYRIASAAGIWGNVSTLVRLVSSEGGSLSFTDREGSKGYYETGETVSVKVLPEDGRSFDISVSTETGKVAYEYDEEEDIITFIKPKESVAIIVNFVWGRATRLNDVDAQNVEYAFDYMLKHINEEYVNAENIETVVLADALLVKNTIADARKMNGVESIDDLWADVVAEGIENTDMEDIAFISQSQAPVMLYDIDPESDYYVAYANHMVNDTHSRTTDWCFAYSNNDGEIVNDCIYDDETGLAYIPKHYTEEDKMGNGCLNIQMQILHVYDTDDIVADVNVIVEKGETAGDIADTGVITSEVQFDEIYIQLAKDDVAKQNISADNICVIINDLYYEFVYSETSGIIAIPANPASSDEIHIFIDGEDEEKATDAVADKILSVAKTFGFVAEASEIWKSVKDEESSLFPSSQVIIVSGTPVVGDTWDSNTTHYAAYMPGKVGSTMTINPSTSAPSFNNTSAQAVWSSNKTKYGTLRDSTYITGTQNTVLKSYRVNTSVPLSNDVRGSRGQAGEAHTHYYGIYVDRVRGVGSRDNSAVAFINGNPVMNNTSAAAAYPNDLGLMTQERGLEIFTIISNGHKGVSNGRTYTYDGWFNNSNVLNADMFVDGQAAVNAIQSASTLNKSYILPLGCVHVGKQNVTNPLSGEHTVRAKVLYVDTTNKILYIGYLSGERNSQSGYGVAKYSYVVEQPITFDATKEYSENYYYKTPWLYKKEGATFKLSIGNSEICRGTTNKKGQIEWSSLTTYATNAKISISTDKLKVIFPKASYTVTLEEIGAAVGSTLATGKQTATFDSNYSMTYSKYSASSVADRQKNSPLYDYVKKSSIALNKSAGGNYSMSDFNGAEFEIYMTPYDMAIMDTGLNIIPTADSKGRTVSISNGSSSNTSLNGNGYDYSDIIYKVGTFKIENGKIKAYPETLYWKYTISANKNVQNSGGTFADGKSILAYTQGAYITASGDKSTTKSSALTTIPSVIDAGNGNQAFGNLPLGKYVLIETKQPSDARIGLSTELKYSWMNSYISSAWNDKKDNDNVLSYTFNVVETENSSVSLTLSKHPDNDEFAVGSVQGAVYDVYYSESGEPVITIGEQTKNGDGSRSRTVTAGSGTIKAGTFTVDGNGTGIVTWLCEDFLNDVAGAEINVSTMHGKEGYYRYVEVKSPKNYGFDDAIQETSYHLVVGQTANAGVSSSEPTIFDPLILDITKKGDKAQGSTINSDAVKNLEDTRFTLNFYKGYTNWTEIKDDIASGDIVPDKVIEYKPIYDATEKKYVIRFDDDAYITSADKPYVFGGYYGFPIGIYTVSETQVADGYSIKNNEWTDTFGNTYPVSGTAYSNNAGLVFRVMQSDTDANESETQILVGETSEEWELIDETQGLGTEITATNVSDKGTFEFIKNAEYEDGSVAGLGGVKFTLYYLYSVKKGMTQAQWNTFLDALAVGDSQNYLDILAQADETWEIQTLADGSYKSQALYTGDYVLVENECDANKGLILSNPKVFNIEKDENDTTVKNDPVMNYAPSISTQEWDGTLSTETIKTHMSSIGDSVVINDTISYHNLKPNTIYTFKAALVDVTDGNAVLLYNDNGLIQKTLEHTTPNGTNVVSGEVEMSFDALDVTKLKDASGNKIDIRGRKVAVYEFLFEGEYEDVKLTKSDIDIFTGEKTGTPSEEGMVIDRNGKVAGHYVPDDINQIAVFPEIHTTESDNATLNHVSPIWDLSGNEGKIKISDTLTYKNLDTALTYTVRAYVKDGKTNAIISGSEKTVVLTELTSGDGQVTVTDIEFTATKEQIDSFYVCEELYLGQISDNVLIISHTEKVEEQTGYVAYIGTTAKAGSDNGETENGIHTAWASEKTDFTDTIEYHNLSDYEYDIICEWRYVGGEHNGEIVKDAKGKTLTVSVAKKKLSDGTIDLVIKDVDCTNLKGQTIVAFETIYFYNKNNEKITVAYEHESNNKKQSITFKGLPVNFEKVNQYGDSLSGATLRIVKSDDKVMDTWTTDGRKHMLELEDGRYTLKEISCPEGYAHAADIAFEVKEGTLLLNGKAVATVTVTMTDTDLTALPDTGGMGTLPFAVSGFFMMLALPVYSIIRKKRKTA